MNCNYYRVEISTLLDGNLEAQGREVLEQHLAECVPCADFLAGQRAIYALLDSEIVELEPSPSLWLGIQQRLAPEPVGRWEGVKNIFSWPEFRPAFAALSVVFICSLLLLRVHPDMDQQLLVEMDAYKLDVPANPFLPQLSEPAWYDKKSNSINPFAQLRSSR